MSTFRQFGSRFTRLATFAVNKLSATNGALGRILTGIVRSTGWPAGSALFRRPPPSMASRHGVVKAVRAGIQRTATANVWRSSLFGRIVGNSVRTNSRAVQLIAPWARQGVRPQRFPHHRISLSAALAGFAYVANKDNGMDGAFERVRDLFKNHCRMRPTDEYPKSLDGYDVGYWMAQGCNGVIYEARIGQQTGPDLVATSEPSTSTAAPIITDNSEFGAAPFKDDDYERWLRRKEKYPLAIKLCFNLEFTKNTERILRNTDRERELVPATAKDIQGLLKKNRPIPYPHPNIVDLKTAFIDDIRPLPFAEEKWSAALALGLGGQTLYMVMKRYSMTLRQYILMHRYDYRTARLLFGQLLEAITYLVSCQISHRDMKSNNILVDFDHPDEPPRLVLADFGSCLSNGDLKLPFHRDGVDLGGNCALRAPEVICAVPGLDSYVDFSKADLWAAGTLAYEIFTRENPFYFPPPVGLSNITYSEDELKPLPNQIPPSVRDLVGQLLKRDPDERPSAPVAANVVALSLFRTKFLRSFLDKMDSFRRTNVTNDIKYGYVNWKTALTDVANLYAAETILGRFAATHEFDDRSTTDSWRLSKTEEQLRMTFLSRVDSNSLAEALRYFEEE